MIDDGKDATDRPAVSHCTLREAPALTPRFRQLFARSWPEFMFHGDVREWSSLIEFFPEFQLALLGSEDELVAAGQTVPIPWDGQAEDLPATIDAIVARANAARRQAITPRALVAVAAMVDADHRRRGLSTTIVRGMRRLAREHGLGYLLAPLRPTLKERYPLIPLESYVTWTRADGAPFDPWLRVHARLGARQLGIAPETLVVTGSVAEWERWTAMRFPGSGRFVVPGALQPVEIDRERDVGRYADPNVWMRHTLD